MRIGGQLALTIKDVGANEYTSRFLCSVYGWKRFYTVGQGATVEDAIADWCRQTGNDRETVRRECDVIGDVE